MNKSEQINELATALSLAQSEIKGAEKGVTNTFFNSRYADLASVWDACRAALTKNGLCVVQTVGYEGDKVYLSTTLMHKSGQWIGGVYPINPVKNDPQAWGSATTYARRYSLAAMVGVCPEDDDGNAASGKTEPDKKPTPRPPPPVQPMKEETYNCIVDLMQQFEPPQKNVDAWLSKAGVDSIRKIDEERGQHIIVWLKGKIEKAASNG